MERGRTIAQEVRQQLLHHVHYLSNAVIHVDPVTESGQAHYRISEHEHDDFKS
ncbi:hypothetical protein NITMOv2_2896 [Nitrospira moscoviensis]|uniref:Cation efflux protein cytoplasmic domain-containing protein n=1 Tax=Nitrospira moscoviensis TaxID=42253 RepID=A0A0K2GFC3_NITMO|nr:hypothetical protein NITMOv2_2896 [Nitrospira moscoviensis]